MAKTISFEPNVLDPLAEALRFRLLGVVDPPPTAKMQIAESFELWQIGRIDSGGTLAELAWRQDRFHHQILVQGEPLAVARTAPMAELQGLTLVSVAQSHVAAAIDRAIDTIDKLDVSDAFTARLLAAPAYNVIAFWFVNESSTPTVYGQLYVVTGAPTLDRLPVGELISEDLFLSALRQEQVIRGWRSTQGM